MLVLHMSSLVALWLALNQMPAPTTPAQHSLTIAAEHDTVQVGAEIKVKVVLKNTSASDIKVHYLMESDHAENADIRTEVRGADGNLARFTHYGELVYYFGPVSPVHLWYKLLKPGESLTGAIIINNQYDLSAPGEYTIFVQRKDDAGVMAKSNTIKVTVTPATP